MLAGQLVQPAVPAASHVTQLPSQALHELEEEAKEPIGHAAMHAPLCKYGAIVGQLRQLAAVPPLHVAQLESHGWQTELESAYMPLPHDVTQVEPRR